MHKLTVLLKYLLSFVFALSITSLYGQQMVISGKVTDANTGEGMPFVNVFFKGTTIGANTDFEGFYTIKAVNPPDSLTVSYLGYHPKSKAINRASKTQTINFQLSPSVKQLAEVVIRPTENPAFRIMRQVNAHKSINDKRKLSAYQYEAYTKIEFDVNNISEKFKRKKILGPITAIFDSLTQIAGEDGKPVLPVFISESLSDYYYLKNPKKIKETIKATKVTGVGMQDGSLVSQLVGSTYQEYNFYQNWISMLDKDFVSPLADSWKMYYEYDLIDSLYVGNTWTYKINITPKRKQDLAFRGTIWIADTTFALRQIDVTVGKEANINYIDKIKLQQELLPTRSGAWMPVKTRVLIDISELGDSWAGMLGKFYTSNKNIEVNQPKPVSFYEKQLEVAANARQDQESFWEQSRHDSLTQAERNVYAMIDSIRDMPVVKTYVEIANTLINGYKTIGKIDLGPYAYTYAFNNIEGHRLRLGMRTNANFSRKFVYEGFLAYGTRDQDLKYASSLRFILSRKRWSEFGISHKHDIEMIGIDADRMKDYTLFLAASRFGNLNRPYYENENKVWLEREVFRGVTQKITLQQRSFDPLFDFAYISGYTENGLPVLKNSYNTTEFIFESRYAHNERFVEGDNERISLGNEAWPVLSLRYTAGLKNVLNSDIGYHRLDGGVSQRIPMGTFGNALYEIRAGKIFSKVPYPLLEVHLGNERPFYNMQAFNLMNFFEFASDTYASISYDHYFEGMLLNRIPLIRRLKWRMLATSDVLYGHISKDNLSLIPTVDSQGEPVTPFQQFDKKPYVEVGYGIENIFRIVRIDAIHRVTYRNLPEANNFGVKLSFQFKL